MAVYVVDKQGHPLMPCSEKRARLLLERGRARVHRRMPFVIRLTDRKLSDSNLQSLVLKVDPGSRFTGLSLVRQQARHVSVLSLMELAHRGTQIKKAMGQRAGYRRRRRSQNLRYRAPRFDNRTRPEGWLPPSLRHRLETTLGWVQRLRRWAPISELAVERVKFDMQAMQNPEISGVEYQQGELVGYEVREYLLEKWGRCCAYCGADNLPLEIEHIQARTNGGSDRVSNLTLACRTCNQRKGNQRVEVFLKAKPELLARIKARVKTPLRDVAAVNATRNALFHSLLATRLPMSTGTGAQTKFNRIRFGLPKTHALDAVCIGEVESVIGWQRPTLTIKATGRGQYQRTRLTAHGFARGYLSRQKRHFGFQTGDQVLAVVPAGKKSGRHQGRVAVRRTGSFNIQTSVGVVQSIHHRHCKIIQRADGYAYAQAPPPDSVQSEGGSEESRGTLKRAALSLLALKGGVSRVKLMNMFIQKTEVKPNNKRMEKKEMKHPSTANNSFNSLFLMMFVAVSMIFILPEVGFASGGIDDFSGPFEKVMQTITGPWGRIVSIAGMAICGVVFIFNRQDMGEGFKMMLQVVFGICFICFAATIVDSLFGGFSGAVI